MPSTTEWRYVANSMPSDSTEVLVYIPALGVRVAYWSRDKWWWAGFLRWGSSRER